MEMKKMKHTNSFLVFIRHHQLSQGYVFFHRHSNEFLLNIVFYQNKKTLTSNADLTINLSTNALCPPN